MSAELKKLNVDEAAEAFERVVRDWSEAGLDLVRGFATTGPAGLLPLFDEQWSQQLLSSHMQEALAQGRVRGLVLGNTRRIWPKFLAWLAQRDAQLELSDPLDRYVSELLQNSCAQLFNGLDERHYSLLLGHQLHPAAPPIQRLAEHAGLAQLSPGYLCVHPTFGPWIALRAVVLVDSAYFPLARPEQQEPLFPCADCVAPCREPFEQAMRPSDATVPGPLQLSAQSRAWLAVREACPVAREERYSAAQLSYHYDKSRLALKMALEEIST